MGGHRVLHRVLGGELRYVLAKVRVCRQAVHKGVGLCHDKRNSLSGRGVKRATGGGC